MDPKIYLAIDNCFAIKRWTTPGEWVRVIQELGLNYVEGVPDLEIEPLLMEPGYRADWLDEMNRVQAETGIRMVMLYSNNSTYDTIGLAHPDKRVRDYIIEKWFATFMDTAVRLDASVGYFVHAFPEYILFDKSLYAQACDNVMDSIIRLNTMAKDKGIREMALEQMYTPNQVPFTIDGMKRMMQSVLSGSGKALYLTEDVGHHCPYYVRPTADAIRAAYRHYRQNGYIPVWLGSREAQAIFTGASPQDGGICDGDVERILDDAAQNGHLFSAERDNSCYEWLKELGCYSPVVHLQQTDGTHSSHKPFTPENNRDGIIRPLEILRALKESCDRPAEAGMPERCEDVYLTFELYASTKQIGYQVLYELRRSVEYWREFIPKDGMRLSELLKRAQTGM